MQRKLFLIPILFLTSPAFAFIHNPGNGGQYNVDKSATAGCLPPSTSAELDVNNVRALIHSGGDMWWDLIGNPRYEVPKGSGRHSLFVGSLWIGGRDKQTHTLKVAAQRYRNSGVDFWTGPLTTGSASTDPATCTAYDQIFKITRAEVEEFCLCNSATGTDPSDPVCDNYQIPESILNWPGNPPVNGQPYAPMLAPYADVDSNGYYDPHTGDYPLYDLTNAIDCRKDRRTFLYGDFTLWWVFNDRGNIHGETGGTSIGMEVRAQGFGFNTNDEVNNMTFYNYELINRGTTTLSECYFGVNTDADLGGANDDYTGCDVERGFGYMYNGDAFDENYVGELGYGLNPPAVGIDFFEGPYVDSNGVADIWSNSWTASDPQVTQALNDLKDTTTQSITFGINGTGFDDAIKDNERFGMRRFVFYNRGDCPTCDPRNAAEYYNYLQGRWRDGSRMVFGGNGYPVGATLGNPFADFMFPSTSDKYNWGTKGDNSHAFDWKEESTGGSPNLPGDRRFVQSAGPFTLKPGAVNDITIGVVWARATSGTPFESVLKVLGADIKAQSLFDNCFRVLNGPNAPDVTIQELDRELVLYLTNRPFPISNNYLNEYEEKNYFIPKIEIISVPVDSDIYLPVFTVFIDPGSGDSLFVYQDQPGSAAADTLIVQYFMGNPVDTVFGYTTNQSTLTNTIIRHEQDTVYYDQYIRFEGYMIYQVTDPSVTSADIFAEGGNNKARLVAQCDVRNFDANGNPIGRLVNYRYDDLIQAAVPTVMVEGSNEGIIHSFHITEDMFATGDKRLVNHKNYYYLALAYGYNNYKTYDPNDPNAINGQKEPFFLGRKNIRVYTGIPHIVSPEANGTVLNTLYGMGPQITRIEGRGNGGNLLMLTKETEDAIMNSSDYRQEQLTYDYGMGPVKVKVIDPLSLVPRRYKLKVLDANNQAGYLVADTAHWVLIDPDELIDGDSIVAISDKDISQPYEQIIYDRRDGKFLGFSITINQTRNIGPQWKVTNGFITRAYLPEMTLEINGDEQTTYGNGLISATVEYENTENIWLGWFPDRDGPSPLNWVRSGTSDDDNNPTWNSNYYSVDPNPSNPNAVNEKVYIDPEQVFQRGVSFYGGGGLVPYILTAGINTYDNNQPAHSLGSPRVFSIMTTPGAVNSNTDVGSVVVKDMLDYVSSIDIVFTPDPDKWTRCPVLEMQDDATLAYRDPLMPGTSTPARLDLRFSPSVNKSGNFADVNAGPDTDEQSANYISPWGMSWFPGYAIDVETGERLNIAFGEDSYLVSQHGRDMLFNPTEADPTTPNTDGWYTATGDYLYAGKHYVYIFGSNPKENGLDSFPHYDQGRRMMELLTDANGLPVSNTSSQDARNLWRNCMWAGIPFHVRGKQWLKDEIRIHLRVNKTYQSGYSSLRRSNAPQNNNNPLYSFSFEGMAPTTHDPNVAASSLDLIQVVPNPYYAASEYETAPLDNRVKIVNLPERCTITIYSLSGTLVRRFEKGDPSTSLDWDLKNFKNIPIASGLYIVHIKADGIGERIIKWYGVLRPPQLDTF